MDKKVIIIDGNSIANRAFYALPLLSNTEGLFTNAVYGFTQMLLRLLEEEKPTHLLVAFDAGKVTFRTEGYKEYKGKRQKTPGELSSQFPLMKELLDAFNIKHYELGGYEADDIIGTLSLEAEAEGFKTLIVSGDKDMLQLVSDNTQVALTRKGISEVELYSPIEIMDKYGLTPAQIIDLKGLMGDASDNIPGIPGVGEKTALKLLHEYHTVEGVLEHKAEVKGKKLQEKLAEHEQDAIMSKELATIMRNAPIEVKLADIAFQPYDRQQVARIFERFSFKSLLDRLGLDAAEAQEEAGTEAAAFDYVVVTEKNRDEWESKLVSPMALMVELDGDNYHTAPILGFAAAHEDTHLYIPFEVAADWVDFKNWLADSSIKKWVYDAKRSQVSLSWHGMKLEGICFDPFLASYLLDPSETNHTLAEIARRNGLSLPSDEAVYGKGAKRALPSQTVIGQHAARKAAAVYSLHHKLEKEMHTEQLTELFYDLELPLASVLGDMETNGVRVNRERLDEMGVMLQEKLEKLTEQIYELAGVSFNINSPKQLGEILFDRLNLPVYKKTKTGYSTSADVLEKLESAHEIIPLILEFRQLGKLQSTYIEGLKKVISDKDGKIHTLFNQAVTATGRLSSTEPNLQNIPIRLEEGRKIRQAFVPSEDGWLIFSADYSQIELRILAHISEDEALIDAFQRDMDIHTRTAMDVFGVDEDGVTSLMRRQAKAVNFGIVYGISDYGLSQNLNITRKQAAEFIEQYFSVFPGVKRYMDNIIEDAHKQGYVTTLLNRRRILPDINSRNFNLRSFAERTAMNTPIQGTAADVIKLAMVNMARRLEEEKLASRMLLQVHDELIFEVPQNELDKMRALVPEVMESALPLAVPLKVDVNYGPSWYEAK
ncbi:DNA polymerase I [Aneurinibacillus sp. Ricciae_BoGa-3]|uniref:DNA polymerase I n=1 Tax=Aneurinibacillus sp. Ricciae_BoGa-3 TaxID=3022697 RepID=UPI002340013D|nr:DNA polymerase I [Aneurinibacillus sp. Ricciae_BoGa-3]WCK55521.1 DNA polymerase I [Aneurinibacillus sp. Ricciae_BoGa-3]